MKSISVILFHSAINVKGVPVYSGTLFWAGIKSILPLLLLHSCSEQNPDLKLPQRHPYIAQNQFEYSVSIYKEDKLIDSDKIWLNSCGKTWPTDPGQFEITWNYTHTTQKSYTGVIVKRDSVWMHPPRKDQYGILEGNAFPMIKRPFKKGTAWQGQVYASDIWFGQYPDIVEKTKRKPFLIEHNYVIKSVVLQKTTVGTFVCWDIEATSESLLGKHLALFRYSADFGFVKMEFNTCAQTRICMDLIAINHKRLSPQ